MKYCHEQDKNHDERQWNDNLYSCPGGKGEGNFIANKN